MEKEFTYTCARCRHEGDNLEITCYNCGNRAVGVNLLAHDVMQISCRACGVDQGIKCVKCETQITWKTIKLYAETPIWVKLIIGFTVMCLLKWFTGYPS